MSVAGLKKQFHKASQLLSEKISGAEGTKLDDDFMEMERKIEVTNKLVFDLLSRTTEYLQPNPELCLNSFYNYIFRPGMLDL
uniref:BAR domain-containing protein n=1 Tax=Anabas testudineus TaxID=64144 RepID=A0A7N6A8N1_ANATE